MQRTMLHIANKGWFSPIVGLTAGGAYNAVHY